MTENVLGQFETSGQLPDMEDSASMRKLISDSGKRDYLAIMAYVRQTPAIDQALEALRRRVTEKHGIATTMGYGPRVLHSTGQLHKGGPGSGLFLQLIGEHVQDLAIPNAPFTFGVLADRQAVGDLQALLSSGRRADWVDLGLNQAGDIRKLAEDIE